MDKLSDRLFARFRAERGSASGKGISPKELSPNVRERIIRHRRRQKTKTTIIVSLVVVLILMIATLVVWPIKTPLGDHTSPAKILSNMVINMRPLPYYFGGREKINVLVVGIDRDPPHRSDTVLVGNIDLRSYQVNLLSVPRDTLVTLPDGRRDKLAHAYAFGQNGEGNGILWVKQSVESLLGISIPYYVTIDFEAFISSIDALGEVEIDVEKHLRYVDRSQDLYIDIPEGKQLLNGEELLKYVRFRHDALGDVGRTYRQQKAVLAIINKLKAKSDWRKVFSAIKTFYQSVDTNFTLDQIVALARRIRDFDEDKLFATTMHSEPETINGISYLTANTQDIIDAIRALREGKPKVASENQSESKENGI